MPMLVRTSEGVCAIQSLCWISGGER